MWIVIGGSLLFLVAGTLAHALDRKVDVRAQGMSYYAAGRYRWLVTLGFIALASAYASLFRVTPLFIAAAIGMIGIALFPVGTANVAHRVAANIFFASATTGSVIASVERKSPPLLALSLAAILLYPLFSWPRMPCRGILQRLCFLCLVAWLLMISR